MIAVGNLNMTKLEVENHYKEYFQHLKENKREIEFRNVQFISIGKSRQILEKMKNPQMGYLLSLLEQEERQLMQR